MRAQFGPPFAPYGALRRRRHEIEYPMVVEDQPDAREVAEALASARALVEGTAAMLPDVGVF